jgi:photosystem II stability/assembly factor-like uncharacterized protein
MPRCARVLVAVALVWAAAGCHRDGGSGADGIEVVSVPGTPLYRWEPSGGFVATDRGLVSLSEHLPTGVVRSTDRGRTWVPSKLPERLLTRRAVTLVANGDAVVLVAAASDNPRRGPLLWVSEDGGASFRDIGAGAAGVPQPPVSLVRVGRTLVLSGARAVPQRPEDRLLWRSDDGGRTWSTFEPRGVAAPAQLGGLQAVGDGRLIGVQWPYPEVPGKVLVSNDRARSWRPLDTPAGSSDPWYLEPVVEVDGSRVTVAGAGRNWVSDHLDGRWRVLTSPAGRGKGANLPATFVGDTVVAVGDTGDDEGYRALARYSTDGGRTWRKSDISKLVCRGDYAESRLGAASAVGDVIYASWYCNPDDGPQTTRLVRSLDHGRSWEPVHEHGLDRMDLRGLVRTKADEVLAIEAQGKRRSMVWLTGG